VEWVNERRLEQEESVQVAIVYIQASQQAAIALRRAAQRVKRNIRSGDTMLLFETSCAVILPGTTTCGAQAVARRIYALLADIEFELQILYAETALTLLGRLGAGQAIVPMEREERPTQPTIMSRVTAGDELPYLAYLSSYPSQRLLHLFPYDLARLYHCVPVGAERGVLTLATCQRFDAELIAQFRNITQLNIFQVRCEAKMIDDILKYWRQMLLPKDEEESDSRQA